MQKASIEQLKALANKLVGPVIKQLRDDISSALDSVQNHAKDLIAARKEIDKLRSDLEIDRENLRQQVFLAKQEADKTTKETIKYREEVKKEIGEGKEDRKAMRSSLERIEKVIADYGLASAIDRSKFEDAVSLATKEIERLSSGLKRDVDAALDQVTWKVKEGLARVDNYGKSFQIKIDEQDKRAANAIRQVRREITGMKSTVKEVRQVQTQIKQATTNDTSTSD